MKVPCLSQKPLEQLKHAQAKYIDICQLVKINCTPRQLFFRLSVLYTRNYCVVINQ